MIGYWQLFPRVEIIKLSQSWIKLPSFYRVQLHPLGRTTQVWTFTKQFTKNMALVLLLSVVAPSLGLDTSDYVGVKIVQGKVLKGEIKY